MREVLNYILLGSLLIAGITVVRGRLWNRYPLFVAYLVAYAFLVSQYTPESGQWLSHVWLWVDPLVLLLKVLAVAEIYRLQAKRYPHARWLTVALLSITAMFLLATWRFVDGGPVLNWIQIRSYVQFGTLSFLGMDLAIVLMGGLWRTATDFRHLACFSLILGAQAAGSFMLLLRDHWDLEDWAVMWYRADLILYLCVAALLIVWAVAVRPYSPDRSSGFPGPLKPVRI